MNAPVRVNGADLPPRVSAARALRGEGLSLRAIAEHLGVSLSRAHTDCRGIVPPGLRIDRAEARRLRALDLPVIEIAKRLGCKPSTVYKITRDVRPAPVPLKRRLRALLAALDAAIADGDMHPSAAQAEREAVARWLAGVRT